MKLFKFERPGTDILNKEQTKVTFYKEVNICAKDEEHARAKAKLSPEYILVETYQLSEDWQ